MPGVIMADSGNNQYKGPGVIAWLVACILVLVSIILIMVAQGLEDGITKSVLGVAASFVGVSVVVSFLTKVFFGRKESQARQDETRQMFIDVLDHHYAMNTR